MQRLLIGILGSLIVAAPSNASGAQAPNAQILAIFNGRFIGCTNISGILFGFDEAAILNDSADAVEGARSRAQTFAVARLSEYGLRNIVWPRGLNPEVAEALQESFFRIHDFHFQFQGVQLIDSQVLRGSRLRVVVQLPDPDHQIPSISSEVFRQELAAALDHQSDKLDLAAYLEFCAESDIPKVVSLLADRLRQYGDGAGTTFAGKRLRTAADFLQVGDAQAVVVTNYSQGFTLLGEHPYDPRICLSLGDFLQRSGHPRSAQLLYSRGQVAFADWPQAAECRRKAQPSSWPLAFSFPQPALPAGLIRRRLEEKSATLKDLSPACRLILESSGHLPVDASPESNKAFREAWGSFTDPHPNLTNALQYAMESLIDGFSADAANLAGRIFMLQGEYELALPFLEQARFLDANHPYAAGNLALALERIGEKQLAATIADAAIANSRTPDSFRIKLAPLQQNRPPATSSPKQ